MKQLRLLKALCLLFALLMIVTATAGCTGQSPAANPASSSAAESSEPEEEPEPEDDLEVERVFLVEKIDQGIKRNPDTVGWLYIPNTEIDDAVLQGPDNDYYLRIDEDKKYDIFGCYFTDFRCKVVDRDNLVKNTIIYGHSDYRDNPDGKKFSQLFKYAQDINFVRNNPYIYFSAPGRSSQFFSPISTSTIFKLTLPKKNFNIFSTRPGPAVNISSMCRLRPTTVF